MSQPAVVTDLEKSKEEEVIMRLRPHGIFVNTNTSEIYITYERFFNYVKKFSVTSTPLLPPGTIQVTIGHGFYRMAIVHPEKTERIAMVLVEPNKRTFNVYDAPFPKTLWVLTVKSDTHTFQRAQVFALQNRQIYRQEDIKLYRLCYPNLYGGDEHHAICEVCFGTTTLGLISSMNFANPKSALSVIDLFTVAPFNTDLIPANFVTFLNKHAVLVSSKLINSSNDYDACVKEFVNNKYNESFRPTSHIPYPYDMYLGDCNALGVTLMDVMNMQ